LFRASTGIVLIVLTDDWFGMNAYLPWGSIMMLAYFLMTVIGGIYFTLLEKHEKA